MHEIWLLLRMVASGVPALLLRPWDFPLFWVLVVLVTMQYKRIVDSEVRLYGVPLNSVAKQVALALLWGLGGGLVASLLMAVFGVSLSGAGVTWLLPLALLLMAVNPRLMCFSYAGGLIAVSNIIFGWPKVYVPAIMALVAVLHVTESLLIFARGASCLTPVTVHHAAQKSVRTGYLMQGFWPLPLLLLFVVTLPAGTPAEGLLAMPDWWPLIVPPAEVSQLPNAVFTLFPVAAVLGYSDLAARFAPRAKARRSALMLAAYSVVLLALSVLGSRVPSLVLLPALWGPLAHEALVKYGSRGEFSSEQALQAAPDGLTVLDVIPRSGAARAGLRRGDVLLTVDGVPATDDIAVADILERDGGSVALEWRREGRVLTAEAAAAAAGPGGRMTLGIIPVPEDGGEAQLEIRDRGALARWLTRLRRPPVPKD